MGVDVKSSHYFSAGPFVNMIPSSVIHLFQFRVALCRKLFNSIWKWVQSGMLQINLKLFQQRALRDKILSVIKLKGRNCTSLKIRQEIVFLHSGTYSCSIFSQKGI